MQRDASWQAPEVPIENYAAIAAMDAEKRDAVTLLAKRDEVAFRSFPGSGEGRSQASRAHGASDD